MQGDLEAVCLMKGQQTVGHTDNPGTGNMPCCGSLCMLTATAHVQQGSWEISCLRRRTGNMQKAGENEGCKGASPIDIACATIWKQIMAGPLTRPCMHIAAVQLDELLSICSMPISAARYYVRLKLGQPGRCMHAQLLLNLLYRNVHSIKLATYRQKCHC